MQKISPRLYWCAICSDDFGSPRFDLVNGLLRLYRLSFELRLTLTWAPSSPGQPSVSPKVCHHREVLNIIMRRCLLLWVAFPSSKISTYGWESNTLLVWASHLLMLHNHNILIFLLLLVKMGVFYPNSLICIVGSADKIFLYNATV